MRRARTAVLVLAILAWAGVARAETIVLNSGRVVNGAIRSMTPATIEVQTEEGVVVVDRAEVLAISLAPAAPATPAASTPAPDPDPAPARGPAPAVEGDDDSLPPPDPRTLREIRAERRARLRREDPMRPFLDHGGAGAKVILNPYSSVRAHFEDRPRVIGEVPFSGGLGVFIEYMGKYVGVGLEVDTEFLQADAVWSQKQETVTNEWGSYTNWSDEWEKKDASGSQGQLGVLVHVWPYLRVRIPTERVDPYFMLQFGYASYSRPFQGNGPYDGVAICPRFGAAIKVNRAVAILVDVGYNFAHLEPRFPENLKVEDIEIHNLVMNLGVMYRF